MSDLLARAFAALGDDPSWHEIGLVAKSIHAAGDEEAEAVLEAGGDTEAFRALAELAAASGSSGFVALDLATAYAWPETVETRGGEVGLR